MILMDNFESYLFNRINEIKSSIDENLNVSNEEGKNEVLWCLNNTLEEVVEILANYTLNYKIWG